MLLKNFLAGFIILCLSSNVQAQNIKFKTNASTQIAILALIKGETISRVDSAEYKDNSYSFTLDKNHPTGLYRLIIGDRWINFIFDHKDIEIHADMNHLMNSVKVINSESNNLFFEFIRRNYAYKTKTQILLSVISQYPQIDDYYNLTVKKFKQLNMEYQNFIIKSSSKHPKSFVSRYIASSQLPVINPNSSLEDRLILLKSQSLNTVNFHDDELINSDVFTSKAIEFLSYYRNPALSKDALELELMRAVDSLLLKSQVNFLVYQHIVDYLIKGFEKYGFNNAVKYIWDQYIEKNKLCNNQYSSKSGNTKTDNPADINIDSIISNFVFTDINNNNYKINEITTDKILIVFYASWCPYCQSLMPDISNLYKTQKTKNIEVIAISIDTSKSDCLTYIRKNGFNWINVAEYNGWSSLFIRDFNINAVPTILFIDKYKRTSVEIPNIVILKEMFSSK